MTENNDPKSRPKHEAEVGTNTRRIILVPEWFKKHMTAVRSQSHAPLSEVLQQAKASEEHRKKFSDKQQKDGGNP